MERLSRGTASFAVIDAVISIPFSSAVTITAIAAFTAAVTITAIAAFTATVTITVTAAVAILLL